MVSNYNSIAMGTLYRADSIVSHVPAGLLLSDPVRGAYTVWCPVCLRQHGPHDLIMLSLSISFPSQSQLSSLTQHHTLSTRPGQLHILISITHAHLIVLPWKINFYENKNSAMHKCPKSLFLTAQTKLSFFSIGLLLLARGQ